MEVLLLTLMTMTAPEGEPVDPKASIVIAQILALQLELLDQRETRYVFSRQEDAESDFRIIRRRWAELGDAPPSQHAVRFPSRENVNELLKFNRQCREHFECRMNSEGSQHYWWFRNTIIECDRLYNIYDLMREAQCEYYYVTVRRAALKKLYKELGPADYWNGVYPPHVPVWRFQRIEP